MSSLNLHKQKKNLQRTARDDRELPVLTYPPELPISEKRTTICEAIAAHQVLVITGETGSGKSTQIPKMCLDAGRGTRGLIGCTQPRRIAAVTLSQRVAEEMGEEGSRRVGYKIRFQDRTARETRIKFMTDGILLAEAQRDRLFRRYDTLIIDEAHERTLNIDFLLGLIKKILPRRPDLKVIITSATIDPEKFSRAFGNAPIIEVSGRTYPVEVRYLPMAQEDDGEAEATYVDQAVAAVDTLKGRRDRQQRGDILIFMPTEGDIRETVQRLNERRYWNTAVLPLFGRMAAADQRRIFELTAEDRIVVATNVAETSITIPRIRYVIDTGLARISQYNPRSRTQGLPIVSISQASADQRKGRCGRVAAGVCIRLYAEEDYLGRAPFTAPEIQRSNLAEVILRMLFLKLGHVQDFPFLDPPSPAAIKDGLAVLQELGAVDQQRRLTGRGRLMARLPLDPRLSRMLLEAQRQGSLRELLVLVAALSIQDPRERPAEHEAQADQAQARFRDRRSDFVTLLRIWEATWGRHSKPDGEVSEAAAPVAGDSVSVEDVSAQSLSQGGGVAAGLPEENGKPLSSGQLRRFCREHFLSYRRMREWRDIHREIHSLLEELGEVKLNAAPASYEQIHRAILSGYLSQVALRKEKNIYLAAKNRQAMIFPGSAVFNKGGGWLVAAELVQTSRLFARTVAGIEPEWLEELGQHLCRSTYSEPHWEKRRGQVVAFERVTLYGLPIVERRKVNFVRIRPQEAHEIFLRSALVENQLSEKLPFMEHNQQLIASIEELESKTRRRDLLVDEEALYRFYAQRLPQIADVRSLKKLLKDRGGDTFLRMTEADLLQAEPDFAALEQYPGSLRVEDLELPLQYVFQPGAEQDGITVRAPVHGLPRLSQQDLEWLVPGMLLEKVTVLLKGLPKRFRKQLVPVADTAQKLLQGLRYREGDLYVQLSRGLQELKGMEIPVDQWNRDELPYHLRMRVEVRSPEGNLVGEGRDLAALGPLAAERHDDRLWESARAAWERSGLKQWDISEVPPKIEVGKDALGLDRHAYPGLALEEGAVAVRLFDDPAAARQSSLGGLAEFYRRAFATELKQLLKDWVFPARMAAEVFFMGTVQQANENLQDYLTCELFALHDVNFTYGWPDRQQFCGRVERLRGKLAGFGRELLEEVFLVVQERDKTRAGLQRFWSTAKHQAGLMDRLQTLSDELRALVPPEFLARYRRADLQQLPRYLKALQLRAERAYAAPEKDRSKARQLSPHQEHYAAMAAEVAAAPHGEGAALVEEFRWLLEEFKISLFAPEIRTRGRISAKRLTEKYQEWSMWKGKLK